MVVRQCRRYSCRAFSTSPVVTAPQPGLPPARLRALISLFHQSSTFITPATLSERINLAFANVTNSTGLTIVPRSHSDLQVQLRAKRNENELGPSSKPSYRGVVMDVDWQWSNQRWGRQALVDAALWGTEWDSKPSLETIRETSDSHEELSSRFAGTDERRR